MKKIVFPLLALFVSMGTTAAVKGTFTSGDLTFTVLTEQGTSGTVSVKAASKDISGKVVIPEMVSNNGIEYMVTQIADQGFRDCVSMTGVRIPESVTYVGTCGFYHCESLDSLVFTNDDLTFSFWYVMQGCKSLTYVRLPENLECLGYFMFAECESLESVRIPESCTKFDEYAFFRCHKLKEVNIPYGVTSLGMADFYECYELEHLEIPPTVTYIGKQAFTRCRKLRTLDLPNSVTRFGWQTFEACTLLKHLTFPSHLKDMRDGACLENCSGLTEVTIPAETEDFSVGLGNLPSLKSIFIMGDSIPTGIQNCSRKSYVTIYVKKSVFEERYPSGTWKGFKVSYRVPVTMRHRYQTLCRDFDMDFSDASVTSGCRVFLASGINASHTNVSVTPISYVPSREMANVEGYTGMDSYNGVIIEGKPNSTYYYRIGEKDYSKGSEQAKLPEDQVNLLVGAEQEKWVTTEVNDDFGDYFLTYGMYNDKFRRYVSNGYVNYNRAYLKIPGSDSNRSKEFGLECREDEHVASSVSHAGSRRHDDRLFDLNGRVVNTPVRGRGVYISNGRKFSLIR